MRGYPLEITGQRFGRLVALKRISTDKHGYAMWLCQCDCGNTKTIQARHLTLKRKPTHSCGCIKKEQMSIIRHNGLPKGEAALNALYGAYKLRARNSEFAFELTREQFQKLTSADCYYCGATPAQVKCDKGYNGGYTYNGVDRIDSNMGYSLFNSVSCCNTCNKMKLKLGFEEFRKHIEKIYNLFVLGHKPKPCLVYAFACADLLHIGHLRAFQQAKALGDYLIVGVLTDEAIECYKRKPVIPFEERLELVSGLKSVDQVVKQEDVDPTFNLLVFDPDILVHGDDWGEDFPGAAYMRSIGKRVMRTKYYPERSTTGIIKEIEECYENESANRERRDAARYSGRGVVAGHT